MSNDSIPRSRRHGGRLAALVITAAIGVGATAGAGSAFAGSAAPNAPAKKVGKTTFSLFPNSPFLTCMQANGKTAKVTATVKRGNLNDKLTLDLSGFKSHLDFDLFTVQNSSLLSDGTPDPNFKNFGLAWYQSDVHTNDDGEASVTVKTILLDQIFGFDPAVSLNPTNTFHLGFWFNDPNTPVPCGYNGAVTPFNGEHNAGPVAFITVPDKVNDLGPLCTDPSGPGVCNP
jgi:hypothetical protein